MRPPHGDVGHAYRWWPTVCVIVVCVTKVLAAPAPAAADSGSASFIYPINGSTNVNTSKPFTWSEVPAAQTYYLYVATTRGADDVLNSRGLSTNSYDVPPLPTGENLWARLWTEVSGSWKYQDISFTAAPLTTARFVYPLAGASAVDAATPFSWYAVSNAQAYYLDVGTTQGAKDLVDSGGLTGTSYRVPPLPTGQLLWARLWTEVAGVWTYQDISFVATQQSHATFVYPTDGLATVDTTRSFSWQGAGAAQAYYLDIGTRQGADDLLNSGGLTTTSYPVPPLPLGRVLWARIWTKVGGAWKYRQDISFEVSVSVARFTYPLPGQTTVNTSRPLTWAAAPGAQAYYIKLGTTLGASDVLDGGETTATTRAMPSQLAIGTTYHARVYTELNGSWAAYTDITFTVAYSAATLANPTRNVNNPNLDVSKPFTWMLISGAGGYDVWIGTTEGAHDVANSGILRGASYMPGPLPTGKTLWVRLWTLASGAWVSGGDVSFVPAARILTPAQQSVTVDPSQPISWAPGAVIDGRAPSYELLLGSHPGSNDLFDSGTTTATSMMAPAGVLEPGRALYARVVVTLGDGTQRRTDTVFAVASAPVPPAQMNWGGAGSSSVDTSSPFTWTGSDLAEAYRLEIVSDGSLILDTGPIDVTRYFAESLSAGTYTADLGTEIAGGWKWVESPFTVVASGQSAANEVNASHWATDYVRHMADLTGYPYAWSDLWQSTNARWPEITTTCGVYALELLTILKEMNVAGSLSAEHQPQRATIGFIGSGYDDHVIDYFWDADDSDWIVLDPTFDIAMKRASDGRWASAADAHDATVAQAWSAITYVGLGDFGFAIAKAYYLDYPLLYLNVPDPPTGSGVDPTPYLTPVPIWPTNTRATYIIQSDRSPTSLVIDSVPATIGTDHVAGFGHMFAASSISVPADTGQHVTLYTPNRYVF